MSNHEERKAAQARESRAKTKAIATVPCPVCGAEVGTTCGLESDGTRNVHLTRYGAALEARTEGDPA